MRFGIPIMIALLVAGCSNQVPLTKGLIKDYGLTTNDIHKLQLYISDGILMEKRTTRIDKNIDSASYSLKKVEDYYVKQIYVKQGTPCIATSAGGDKLVVAFEQPGDGLDFTASAEAPGTNFVYRPDSRFSRDSIPDRPMAGGFSNWKMIGEEIYADTTFSVLVRDKPPYILVDKTGLKNFTVDARRLKGIRQSELNTGSEQRIEKSQP